MLDRGEWTPSVVFFGVFLLSSFDSFYLLYRLQQAKLPWACNTDTITSNKQMTPSVGQTAGPCTNPLPVGGIQGVHDEVKQGFSV